MFVIQISFTPAIDPHIRTLGFEDPLDRFLRKNKLGHVSGGGTDLSKNEADIALEVKNKVRALPLIESLLEELGAPPNTSVTSLEEPTATVRHPLAGDVILMPLDDGSTAICKVLLVPAQLRRHGYVVLGIYGHYKPDMRLTDIPLSPLGAIVTFSIPIRAGRWRILGTMSLKPNEKILYPGPDISLERARIYFEGSAKWATAQLILTHSTA